MARIQKRGSAAKTSIQYDVVRSKTGVMRAFPDGTSVVVPDRKGYGASENVVKVNPVPLRRGPRPLPEAHFPAKSLKEILQRSSSPVGATRGDKTHTAEQYTDAVLKELRTILHERLGTLAAADIDIHSLGSPADVAGWLASALPSSHPFDELIGPFYDADGVASRLRTTVADVLHRAENNALLACPTAEGTAVFPMCQFNSDGSTVAGLPDVLLALERGTSDRWQVALWMNTPVETLNDQTPAQSLRAGDTKAVRKLAEHTAARWRR